MKDNMLVSYANYFDHLSCQMACKMPFDPQHPTILHPWGSCLAVIKGDFVPKCVEQFNRSSQDIDLEYKKYLVLLIGKQSILVVLIEKKKGE